MTDIRVNAAARISLMGLEEKPQSEIKAAKTVLVAEVAATASAEKASLSQGSA